MPILLIVPVSVPYWRYSTTTCALMETVTHLWLLTHPCPSHTPHLFVKKLLKNQQCQLANRYVQLNNYSSYIVNLAWLYTSKREPQWVQCFILVILKLPKCAIWNGFCNSSHIYVYHGSENYKYIPTMLLQIWYMHTEIGNAMHSKVHTHANEVIGLL